MAAHSQPSRRDQSSIKCRGVQLELAPFEHAGIGQAEDVHRHKKSSQNMLSTSDFILAVGSLWHSFNQPSADVLQPKHSGVCKNENTCYSYDNSRVSVSADTKYFGIDSESVPCFPLLVNSGLEDFKVIQKMIFSELRVGHSSSSSLWKYVQVGNSSLVPLGSWRMDELVSLGVSYDFGGIFGSLRESIFYNLKDTVNLTKMKCKKPAESSILDNKVPLDDNTSVQTTDCKYNDLLPTKCKDSLGSQSTASITKLQHSASSLYTTYSLGSPTDLVTSTDVSTLISGLYSDFHLKLLTSADCAIRNYQVSPETCSVVDNSDQSWPEDNTVHENQKIDQNGVLTEDETLIESGLPLQSKAVNVFANHRHAIAGALAGTFVSVCLHPVDTIKTVIQAQSYDEKSITRIFGCIVSERGVTGLYRGIASNIASSAPISAVYTFTYESVKGALLPLLPKEYHSVAHCTAGGCASIATSFIFTPSERIKQQMQVGSHYQNCWTALVGILEKGGMPSLYAGWGAVLCRNIPHSVIKFYTYESLKQLFSPSQSNVHSSLQTLVCGGIAASTAALFTTPFDVVKTRLQTQIPGSCKQYSGVLSALQEIAKHEGLKGLYRGLTPRLAMYMSQGAIFFASYEFFKRAFSFNVPELPAQVYSVKPLQVIEKRENVEDKSPS